MWSLWREKPALYNEEDLLLLSGIQHIDFCERQWALIHIEKQWQENILTIEGQHLHEKADNPDIVEKRKDLIIARAVPLASYELGLYGVADVIEFTKTGEFDNAVKIPKRAGMWKPKIIEYKRGKPKNIDCDKVQVTAQSLCLEEMYGILIQDAEIYYGQIKHREKFVLDENLRNHTKNLAHKMHKLYESGITPKAEYKSYCKSCSLMELCMPKILNKQATNYLKRAILSCENY